MKEYNIESLTKEQLKEIIREGDDNLDNQIRCRSNGNIFLSQDVGHDNLENIAFRFETFDGGTGYVGPAAANDKKLIDRLFLQIKSNWENGRAKESYIYYF